MSALPVQPRADEYAYSPAVDQEAALGLSTARPRKSAHIYIVPDMDDSQERLSRPSGVQRLSRSSDAQRLSRTSATESLRAQGVVKPLRAQFAAQRLEAQSSAKPVHMHTPKASAGLADLLGVSLSKLLTFLAAMLILGSMGVALGLQLQHQPDPQATTVTAVQAGDSLWSIADMLDIEGRSLDEVVSDIQILNGLDSKVLTPGQILVVPTK